jgi:hypothetical protein
MSYVQPFEADGDRAPSIVLSIEDVHMHKRLRELLASECLDSHEVEPGTRAFGGHGISSGSWGALGIESSQAGLSL